jgi:hypothetical protein
MNKISILFFLLVAIVSNVNAQFSYDYETIFEENFEGFLVVCILPRRQRWRRHHPCLQEAHTEH